MPATNFYADGTKFFLTYPQCTLEREQLRDFFQDIEAGCKYLIARELHDDGNPHLHALVVFGRRRRFTDSACFDVGGFHPNIQRCRSVGHVYAYISKDDDNVLANFTAEEGISGETGWGSIVESCLTRGEFLEAVRARFPRDYVLSLERLLAFCEWRYGRDETSYSGRTRESFVEPPTLIDWVLTNLTQVRALRAGPTALGGGPSPLPSNPLKAYIGYANALDSGATALAAFCWKI